MCDKVQIENRARLCWMQCVWTPCCDVTEAVQWYARTLLFEGGCMLSPGSVVTSHSPQLKYVKISVF